MSNRTLLIALLVAAASAALAWLTRPDARSADQAEPGLPSIRLTIDPASVTSVSVQTDGPRATLARNKAAGNAPAAPGWTLTLPSTNADPVLWPADPNAVRAMLTNLAALNLRPDGSPPASSGAPNRTTIRIDSAFGTTSIDLLSAPLAGRLRVAVTSPSATTTGTIPADGLRPASIEELASLAFPHPIRPAGVITGIDIAAGDASLSIERSAGLWSPAGTDIRLDQHVVADLIESLTAIRMAQIIVPFEPAPTATDDPAAITIRVSAQLPRSPGEPARTSETTLRVLEQANIKGDANAVVTRTRSTGSALACRFTLNAQTFPSLPASINSLLDPHPLAWLPGETGSFTVNRPGADAATYTRTLQGWQAAGTDQSAGQPTDRAAIERLLQSLADPHPAALLDQPSQPTDARFSLTLEPIGTAQSCSITVSIADSTVLIDQGRSRWTIEDPDAAMRTILDRLAPPAP